MGTDNRIRVDSKFQKMLRLEATCHGFKTVTSYTKYKADIMEQELSKKLVGQEIRMGAFHENDNEKKKFRFGF